MTRTKYNKLVRDRIPEIIRHTGLECEVVTLSDPEYKEALLEKLLEECQEAINANDQDLIMELADLQEVIDTIIKFSKIDKDEFHKLMNQKKVEKGGFEDKLKLIWSE